MQSTALRIWVLAAVIVQVIMGAARLSRSGLAGTCDQRVMRTAALGGFWLYCLDGECSFSGRLARAGEKPLTGDRDGGLLSRTCPELSIVASGAVFFDPRVNAKTDFA